MVHIHSLIIRKPNETANFKLLKLHLACIINKKIHTRTYIYIYTHLRERGHWGDLDVDGRIILRWIFGKWEGVETGWTWFRIGTDGGHL